MGWEDSITVMVKARKDFKRRDILREWTLSNVQNIYPQVLHERITPAYDGRSAASGSKQSAKNSALCSWLNGKKGVCKMQARCHMGTSVRSATRQTTTSYTAPTSREASG